TLHHFVDSTHAPREGCRFGLARRCVQPCQAAATWTACCGLSRGSHSVVYLCATRSVQDSQGTHSVTASGVVSRCSPPATPPEVFTAHWKPRTSAITVSSRRVLSR